MDLYRPIGLEVFDDTLLENLACALRDAWPILALHLQLDDNLCIMISESLDEDHDQARLMLEEWRDRYPGHDMIGRLVEALRKMGRYDLLERIG